MVSIFIKFFQGPLYQPLTSLGIYLCYFSSFLFSLNLLKIKIIILNSFYSNSTVNKRWHKTINFGNPRKHRNNFQERNICTLMNDQFKCFLCLQLIAVFASVFISTNQKSAWVLTNQRQSKISCDILTWELNIFWPIRSWDDVCCLLLLILQLQHWQHLIKKPLD